MGKPKRWLTRKQMLAAEVYGYSYDHYEDHVGVNIRFDKLMPQDVDLLEESEQEGWDASRIAQALKISEDKVESWKQSYREARDIVDAPTAAESFRRGVRYSIQYAVEQGLGDKASIERLVTQICYRAADFGFRLDMEGKRLSHYSQELREETEYDQAYWQKEIDQELEERLGREEGSD
jgi:hypothetical protein